MNNKPRFIRLHSSDDNSVCMFNVDEIVSVYVENSETVVLTNADEEESNVKESVDKINNYLTDGFVKCHCSDDNTPMLFNIQHIVRCTTDGETSTVYMHTDVEYEVNESVERIFNGINNPQMYSGSGKKKSAKKEKVATEEKSSEKQK